MKKIGRYCIVFAGLIAGYLLFGTAATLLPNEPIRHHARQTIDKTDLQADFWFAFLCKPQYFMDNFTDALILNQACSGGRNSLLTSLLLVPRLHTGGEECAALRAAADGDTEAPRLHYGRYWHGSTFLMRFMLTADDYVGLRMFFYVLSSMLLLWTLAALARHAGAWSSAAFLFGLTLANVFMMQHSIQFVPVLLIALATTLWVLYRVRRPEQLCMTLFVAGSLTSYFDLLTCPLLTWGLPMAAYLFRQREETFVRGLRCWGHGSALWAAGYGTTWAAKWGIATLLTGENVIRDGASQFMVRAAAGSDFTRWDALTRNTGCIAWFYVVIALAVLAVLAARHFNRNGLPTAALLMMTAAGPCLWFMATADHAYLHYWFTYRTLAATVIALLGAVGVLVDWGKVLNVKIE